MATLHVLQPKLDPLDEALSYYVHGRGGWLLTVGLLSLALASLALKWSLRLGRISARVRRGWWCLWLWNAGLLLGALVAADPLGQWDRPPSISGMIHGLAAMVALVVFPIAAMLVSKGLRDNRDAGSVLLLTLARLAVGSLALFLASLVPVFVRPGPPILLGLTERVLFVCYAAWIAAAAICRSPSSGSSQSAA